MAKTLKTDNKFKQLFEICPHFIRSDFEYKQFGNTSGVSYPRFIIETVNRIRKINSDLEVETRTFEKNCLLEEKQHLEKFLEKEDLDKLERSVSTWEDAEQEYWVNQLGKIAALEILTIGKPSLETMTKMAQLPEDLYVSATQICVKLANAVKAATVRAEEEIGIKETIPSSHDPAGNSSGPKKLLLKKVK